MVIVKTFFDGAILNIYFYGSNFQHKFFENTFFKIKKYFFKRAILKMYFENVFFRRAILKMPFVREKF